ncbi:hypothetical protein Hypma_014835 [Hypsizygus marmoreus]|uniref:Uncharacterized protein n=1 Tax=Hypsizygus marmoreus TaxID=39966 RepID=A0A369KCC2_HYPMA|nr:hypothetical protein Hypma_014835 [Hypsizygus marmoreus]
MQLHIPHVLVTLTTASVLAYGSNLPSNPNSAITALTTPTTRTLDAKLRSLSEQVNRDRATMQKMTEQVARQQTQINKILEMLNLQNTALDLLPAMHKAAQETRKGKQKDDLSGLRKSLLQQEQPKEGKWPWQRHKGERGQQQQKQQQVVPPGALPPQTQRLPQRLVSQQQQPQQRQGPSGVPSGSTRYA